ncbi:ethanolamine utilization protein EutN/carboxysome structural protein Ccml [Candidatus Moduliflexus flocculans]|uniref:Ethanolamine utilization protein EutN/carboxysome structural protein Ccml n=1 Tax=Candidatus Moduliflexus flocculans TaxID=1499966 RepID=A0A0S6VV55_9BACT|nr:ethanolamine utilization protein EutN/carboxysome structural protein Ccml [Candidatus Moduliflexus flocculans]
MQYGKVIGRVVCGKQLACLDGLKLLLVQPVNERQEAVGDALVAFDAARAGEGDLVCYETSKEAGWALHEWFTPADAAILGVIDRIYV